jgi:hypothetical protein
MRWRFIVCVGATLVQSSYALAQNHQQICVPSVINGKNVSIVSKEKLAKAILIQNADAQALYINADAAASNTKYQPQWRRIFTDPDFCPMPTLTNPMGNNPGCLSKNPKTGKIDNSTAQMTLSQLRFALSNFIQTQTTNGTYYSTARPTIGTDYLFGDDKEYPIYCVGSELPPVAKAAPGISGGPIRLRLSSDDLNIDAKQKDAFKGLKPATASVTRDGVADKTSFTGQAALGYAIPLDFAAPPSAQYFSAEVVPYLTATQSYSKVDGKAATYGDTNNLAVGALFDANVTFVGTTSVNNVFMAKPQYLWNTKDQSEIASVKFIWQPWTQNLVGSAPLPTINTPFPLGSAIDGYYAQLLFDLRFDSGTYTNKGNNPTTIPLNKSFDRGGSMFGVAFSTPALGPYVTLNVTETLLEGFAGQVPYISLFQASLSYYFDSTGNVGLTFQYKNGRNEDTAEYAQTYTMGLAAKF